MPGPRKKLALLDRLDGNPSKREIEEWGVEALGEPFVPEHLMDDARGVIECIKRSMPSKVYSSLDSYLLSAFGMAWAFHKRASLEISNPDFQYLVKSKRGQPHQNPWIPLLWAATDKMVALSDRLGLDPKSRAALRLPGEKARKSKYSGLIGRPPGRTTQSVSLSV